jgi:hypothetical protein
VVVEVVEEEPPAVKAVVVVVVVTPVLFLLRLLEILIPTQLAKVVPTLVTVEILHSLLVQIRLSQMVEIEVGIIQLPVEMEEHLGLEMSVGQEEMVRRQAVLQVEAADHLAHPARVELMGLASLEE